jgi:hypothetical protein
MTFVIETADKYPQKVQFELHKERCNLILESDLNREIDVHFDVRGKEYNEKYYNSLVAFKIERSASLPAFEDAWMTKTISRISSGELTLESLQSKYEFTLVQAAKLKAAVPNFTANLEPDDLPF